MAIAAAFTLFMVVIIGFSYEFFGEPLAWPLLAAALAWTSILAAARPALRDGDPPRWAGPVFVAGHGMLWIGTRDYFDFNWIWLMVPPTCALLAAVAAWLLPFR